MFSTVSAVLPGPDGGFVAEIEPGWLQGPGAFGGLSAAMLLRAMSARTRWPPRSLTVQFCAPVPPGACRIEVDVVREGSATVFLAARLLHAERVCVHAIASFGADRATDLDVAEIVPLDVPPADTRQPAVFTQGPVFLRNWEVRMVHGSMPFSGATEGRVAAWVRALEPEPVDVFLAAALLDVMPPAILPKASQPRPMASMSLSVHFLSALPDPTLDPARPLLVDVVSKATEGGYSDQEGKLLTPEGRVLAVVRQLVAVIR